MGQHLALLREVLSRARPLAWADYLAGQAAALDDPGEGRAPFHRLATAVVERLVAWLQRAAEMFCGEEPTPGAGRSGANSPPRMGSSPRCSSPNDRRGAGGHKGPSARQARALRAALGEVAADYRGLAAAVPPRPPADAFLDPARARARYEDYAQTLRALGRLLEDYAALRAAPRAGGSSPKALGRAAPPEASPKRPASEGPNAAGPTPSAQTARRGE